MTSRQGQRQPVFTPALEGSKRIVPITAQLPADHFRALSRGGQNRPGMAFYPSRFPPIHPGYYNGYPYFSPRQPRYMGPPSLMPMWGGYSIGPNYYPGKELIFYLMELVPNEDMFIENTYIVLPYIKNI